MILVKVWCKVCDQLLEIVEDAPVAEAAWAGLVPVRRCPRHGGAHGSVAKWVEAQKRLGRPYDQVPVVWWIPWADLRPAVEKARRTGKTQPHTL